MTFVLIHGGGFTGSCWGRLVPFLDAPVHPVDLPGRGSKPADLMAVTISDFVDSVVDEIVMNDLSDVVLVGHSLAGVTLPGVTERLAERLRHLVLVSCAVPPDGQRVLDILEPEIQAVAKANATNPPAPLDPGLATTIFCNDMDEDQTKFTLNGMVAEAAGVLFERVSLAGLRKPVPRTYVRLLRDVIAVPAKQDQMIHNLGGARVAELDSGHMAMISHPQELAAILNTFSA